MNRTQQQKNCPRCQKVFLCKPNVIEDCQCCGVTLEKRHHDYLAQEYSDCLCIECLKEIKKEVDLIPV